MMFKRFLFVIAIVTAIVSAYYAIFFVQEYFDSAMVGIIKVNYVIENRGGEDLFVKGNADAPWISVPSQTSGSLVARVNFHQVNCNHDLWIKRSDGSETKLAYCERELQNTLYDEDIVRSFSFVESKFHVILQDNHVYLKGIYREYDRKDFEEFRENISSSATVTSAPKPLLMIQTQEITNIDSPTLTGGLCLPVIRSY